MSLQFNVREPGSITSQSDNVTSQLDQPKRARRRRGRVWGQKLFEFFISKWRILVDSKAIIYLFFFTTKLHQQHCKNTPVPRRMECMVIDHGCDEDNRKCSPLSLLLSVRMGLTPKSRHPGNIHQIKVGSKYP